MGLLIAPEESDPPPVLRRANELAAQFRSAPQSAPLLRLLADPALLAAHRALMPARPARRRGDVDVALAVGLAKLADCEGLTEAEAMLTRQEKMALLSDARGVEGLVALGRT
jgi:membrane glycosyltransferase